MTPHLARPLLDGERAETHLEARHQGQQRRGPGDRDLALALDAVHQPGPTQHLRVQALGGQEQDGELGGVGRAHVLVADAPGLQANAAFQRITRRTRRFQVAALLRVEQPFVILARELGVDRQPHGRFARRPGETHRELHPRVAAGDGGHVGGVLVRRQRLLQDAGQLHLAEHAA